MARSRRLPNDSWYMYDQHNTRDSKQGFKCVCETTMKLQTGVHVCEFCARRYLIERVYTVEIDERSNSQIFSNGQVKHE